MNPQDIESINLSLLRYCSAASNLGMRADVLLQDIRAEGRRWLTPEALDRQLRYLVGKGLLATAPKQLNPENLRYLVTAAGEDFIASEMGRE